MSDDPFFPPPPDEGGPYREPEEPPHVEPAPKHVLVSRAIEPDAPPTREDKKEELAELIDEERRFRARQSFWASYPRTTGAVLVVVGGILGVYGLVMSPRHGVGTSSGVVLAATGLWSLVAGSPATPEGRLRPWWAVGCVTINVIAIVVALAILLAR